MKKFVIIIGVILILIGALYGFDHSLSGLNNPNLEIVPTLTQQTASVPINYGANNYGFLDIQTFIGGVYYYQNEPYVASSYTPSGASTYFEGYAYLNWTLANNCPSTTYSTTVLTISMSYTVTLADNQSNYIYASGTQTYSLTVRNSPTSLNGNPGWYSGEVIRTSPSPSQLFLPMTIAGEQNNIIQVKTSFSVSANPPNADNFQNFNNPSGNVMSEAALLPSGAALSPPTPDPVVEGHSVSINYQTQFGAGDGYFLQIHGSSAYDGGAMVKNISLGDNVQSTYSYTVPSNAFVLGAQGTGNEWYIDMYDNNFELITQTVFTVNSTNSEPPAPVITLTSTPQGVGGTWLVGQTMSLKITSMPNQNTSNPINFVIVSIFTGSSASTPQLYVVQNEQIIVSNNVSYITFQLPDTPQNVYITAQSVDSEGITSAVSMQSISSLEITSGHLPINVNVWFTIAIFVSMVLGILAIAWIGVLDVSSKIVLATSYAIMLILIYVGNGGVL